MAKPSVFISHSARHDGAALALLEALATRLKTEGFEVLIDRTSLVVGNSWEAKIANWLDQCHVAMVLFTTRALASDYVRCEVSSLLHRWHRAGRDAGTVPLLPILVKPLTPSHLQRSTGEWRCGMFNVSSPTLARRSSRPLPTGWRR